MAWFFCLFFLWIVVRGKCVCAHVCVFLGNLGARIVLVLPCTKESKADTHAHICSAYLYVWCLFTFSVM